MIPIAIAIGIDDVALSSISGYDGVAFEVLGRACQSERLTCTTKLEGLSTGSPKRQCTPRDDLSTVARDLRVVFSPVASAQFGQTYLSAHLVSAPGEDNGREDVRI